MAVINVSGKAFFKNFENPVLKFLSNSNISVRLCIIECKKQK